jgi:tetratricopeptide (TPR) repeat protein
LLLWSANDIADVLLELGRSSEALPSCRAGLEAAERLAGAQPGNAVWQAELAESRSRLGAALLAQHDLPGALASYRAGLEIAKRRAEAGGAAEQRELAGFYSGTANVLRQIGDLTEALQHYRPDRRSLNASPNPSLMILVCSKITLRS